MGNKRKRLRKRFQLVIRRRRMLLAKSVPALPHLFTLGNAFFGFLSILFSSREAFIAASYCILIGALMDALDGRIARYFNVESLLGIELDSLCDAITFCLAPAFLIYYSYFEALGLLGIIVSVIYVIAGLFRLARFNLISGQQSIYFLGLPTTASACFLAALVLNIRIVSFWTIALILLLMLKLSFLMVSNIHFPSFKKVNFRFKPYSRKTVATIFAIITIFKFKRMLLILLTIYIAWAIALLIISKSKQFVKKIKHV